MEAQCHLCPHPKHEGGACLYVVPQPDGGIWEQPCQCHVPARVESWFGARDAITNLDKKVDALHRMFEERLNKQGLELHRNAKLMQDILLALQNLPCARCGGSGSSRAMDEIEERPSEPPNGG